jgi:hypothetical protein
MRRISFAITFLLGSSAIGWAQQDEYILPAGTLMGCTLDEPNFSSQTAERGDPVLCHVNSLESFGRPLVPQGAYLSAKLEDYRDPGHFVGKGWLQLEFTSLALPGGIFPLNAKVISVAHFRVDGQGRIHGHGHPVRDAVEWTIPVLWPIKVLTLPARGPRPTLKGETRVELRVMEDMAIPASATTNIDGLRSRSSLRQPPGGPSILSRPSTSPAVARTPLTVIVLRGGGTYLVADYWVDRGYLNYTTGNGWPQVVPLGTLDMRRTQQINAERGVVFTLTTGNR